MALRATFAPVTTQVERALSFWNTTELLLTSVPSTPWYVVTVRSGECSFYLNCFLNRFVSDVFSLNLAVGRTRARVLLTAAPPPSVSVPSITFPLSLREQTCLFRDQSVPVQLNPDSPH